jgi:predicted DNA-binding protein (MmcQ/YjbR family)
MNLEGFRAHCLSKKGVTEETPFGPDTLVYKVMGKMFALTGSPDFVSVNLKADPGNAVELRERYVAVQPGYHMNKKHWNTVLIDGSIPDKLILQWLEDSYQLVVAGLTKKEKSALDKL